MSIDKPSSSPYIKIAKPFYLMSNRYLKQLLDKRSNQKPLIFAAAAGLLILLIISFTLPFNKGLFSRLFNKPSSHAATSGLPFPISNPANFTAPTVFAYYYTWYSAPPRTSNYGHWDGGGMTGLPDNTETAYYPGLGPYDSYNPQVIAQHMQWMKQAGVDVVIVSWWGQGSPEDENTLNILNGAEQAGLKVSFMIEPYPNRTIQTIASDIPYIYSHYGSHPAFYKVSRPTYYGKTNQPRGMFFIYNLPLTLANSPTIAQTFDSFRGTANDGIFLTQYYYQDSQNQTQNSENSMFTDYDVRVQLAMTHADGLFNYGEFKPNNPPVWTRSNDYMLIYSVLPGWDHRRELPFASGQPTDPTKPYQDRESGQYYDDNWSKLISQEVEGISILSFNEWHEGGQVEPAVPHVFSGNSQYPAYTYQNYEGAYGKTATAAAMAYIDRSGYWSSQYKQSQVSVTPTPTPAPSLGEQISVNYSLVIGNNLIGLPLYPLNLDGSPLTAAELLNLTNGSCSTVATSEPYVGNFVYTISPGLGVLNTLTNLIGGRAYAISCTAPVNISLSGNSIKDLTSIQPEISGYSPAVNDISLPQDYTCSGSPCTADSFLTRISSNGYGCYAIQRINSQTQTTETHVLGNTGKTGDTNFNMNDTDGYQLVCSLSPSSSNSPSPTPSLSPSPTPSLTPSPTPTETPSPTLTPSPTPSPTVSPTPTLTPTPSPTLTPTQTPPPSPRIVGDINGDGHVDLGDLSLFASSYGTISPNIPDPRCDLNNDGFVNLTDLSLLAANYGI